MFGRTKTEPEPARSADDGTQAYPAAHHDEQVRNRHSDHTMAPAAAYGTAHHDPQVEHDDRHAVADRDVDRVDPEQARRDRFGGVNWGAGFFGWLVAVAVTVLLAAIVGGVTAGTNADEELLPAASTTEIGLAGVITLGVILIVAYYAGGYVAGRMSRYDGPRQGLAVWLIGVLTTAAAVAATAFLGNEYDVLERVELPSIPVSTDTITTGGIIVIAVYLAVTLLAAMGGGSVGRHYHAKIDRYH